MTTTPVPARPPAGSKPPATHLCHIDLETTNTDPYAPYAAVLEIGAIITRSTPDLPEVARASLIVRPPGGPTDHAAMWASMVPIVQQMHHESGLWREATIGDGAWGLTQADNAFTDWLTTQVEADGGVLPVPLAGAGIGQLDLPYVKSHLPRLASVITYWPLDISPTRRMLQIAGRDDYVDLVGDVDAKPHRALGDIELHVAEARRYLAALQSLPPAPTVTLAAARAQLDAAEQAQP